MRLALVAVLADDTREVQISWLKGSPNFLARLAAGASVGGFADVHFQFTAARTPEAAIRFLRPFEQQDFIVLVETIEQRGDFVR